MYRIVVSDMDGTLLKPDHTLGAYTRETLQCLTAKGIQFIFATGRHHIDIGQIRDRLGIPAYMITSNGAHIHDPQGALISHHDLDPAIARELYGIVHDDPLILTNVYCHNDWYMNRDVPEENDFFQESEFSYRLFDPATLPTEGIVKVFFTSDQHAHLEALEQQINARWGNQLSVTFSLPGCLEVMASGVTKGRALMEILARQSDYDLQDCIAFGDGLNDAELLTCVGKGCLMANAWPTLKSRYPQLEVIGSNAEEAVAHYLRRLYAI